VQSALDLLGRSGFAGVLPDELTQGRRKLVGVGRALAARPRIVCRFWWLPGARTQTLRRGIAEVFAKYEVEAIAPSFGCVIRVRDAVERHVRVMDELLESAAAEPSIGLEVGNWSVTGASR
jgi:hypothetical protein